MYDVFGLKLNFIIDKLDSGLYGYEGWKVLWDCFDMDILRDFKNHPTFDFFSGDTGSETFCICIETPALKPEHQSIFDDLARKISFEPDFNKLASKPGIERYSTSIIVSPDNPYTKTLSIINGKITNTDDYASPPALEAIKPYVEYSRAWDEQEDKEEESNIRKPVDEADLNGIASQMIEEGKSDDEIIAELEFYKATNSEAKEVLDTIYISSGNLLKRKGKKNIIWGLVWAVGGGIATVISMSSSGGGYYVFWGAIVFGFRAGHKRYHYPVKNATTL